MAKPDSYAPGTKGRPCASRGITVCFHKSRCIHFGACLRGLPEVFD